MKNTSRRWCTSVKAVPRLFYQLFTIFVSINHHALPALHILMTNKSEKLYSHVVLTIRQLLPSFNPTFAIADFEIVPRNSFTQVFPSITIVGCWFHDTKAIYDNVKKIGLSKLYKKNQKFRIWISKLMGLPLLPEEEILPVFLSLEQWRIL